MVISHPAIMKKILLTVSLAYGFTIKQNCDTCL